MRAVVAAQFTAGLFAHATALVDDEATVEAIREHACNAHVLHFACHAHFRADNPMFSALQLHDGDLTAESIESLRQLPGTVVLSACETALAQHGPGDEMVGLIRAFLVGGAARVVATLWRIDDAATQRFMMHFYPALRAGGSIAAALSVARAAVRREHPHPFYWAGFTLHGGW